MTDADQLPDASSGKDKKKDKVRSVWISFVGRIVAQIIGAVASVVLGIMVLQRYQQSPAGPDPTETSRDAKAVRPRTSGNPAIAVLPLDNFSDSAADAYFAAGMTEILISDLAQIEGWHVISRTSTEGYRNSQKSIEQIGSELNVDLIVEGSVTKVGDQVRVVVQLIDAKSDEHVWSRSYDRATKDVLALQSELAREIAKSVKAAIVPQHEARLVRRESFDPAVYDLYLRGRHAWNLRTPEGLATAIDLFSEAVRREPQFALAHVGLADAYVIGGSPSTGAADARSRMARAKSSAERALAIAGHMAEAHTSYGGVLFFGDRNVEAAEQSFRRAIELNPNYPVAHQWLAILLAEGGRDDEARRHAETAVKLDPMEATFHQAVGLVHYYGRRFSDAAGAARQALAIRPQLPFARIVLVKSLVSSGDAAGAVRSCDEVHAGTTANIDLLVHCAVALHRAGDARAPSAFARLQSMRPVPAPALAQWYAATGDTARAFSLFERLQKDGNLPPNLAFDPLFDPLRVDPRFATFASSQRR